MMIDFMNYIAQNAGDIIEIALLVVGAFAVLATMTPNEVDNKIANVLVKIVNFFGANFGKAKNK